ncbi:MAG: hydantoinase/oxoprolinase family protein [Thermoleophilia bacterium]|nr:hydantoinase/oxoprolinase family protein [Thermoleophilia bacterium]
MRGAFVGIDVGGTFTDLVAVADGAIVRAKVPSTREQADGVLRALAHAGVEEAAEIRHGTTVATNALLERRGARTALVTTAGFRDVLEIGRQDRPSLYDLRRDRPPPLVSREHRFTVRERMGPGGVLTPLDRDSLARTLAGLRAAAPEAVAVCLLFGYLHPAHERAVGAAVREELPGAHVALASEVLPAFREYERFSTTTASAYLGPRLGSYLGDLAERLREQRFPAPLVMLSSGGVASVEEASARAAACVLSGPAGGAVGAARIATLAGHPDALTLDMGGTSADVALVRGGEVATTNGTHVGGVPIALPALDVHSVSAGGGSVAWADDGGALRVGPRSAGAHPGPAAYARGGEDPTVTDAHVLLGHLEEGALLGGEVRLVRGAAEAAIGRLAALLGLAPREAAEGVLRVANAEMARALRLVSVERGIDPRRLALVAFGGAGPMHACALADELGIRTVLVPRAGGVLSALGLALAPLRRDRVAPAAGDLERAFASLEAAAGAPGDAASSRRFADVRYVGQAHELTVPAAELAAVPEAFHAEHERRHGYRMDEHPVEIVTLRVAAVAEPEPPRFPAGDPLRVEGPAIVDLGEATCVVAAGWRGMSDAHGTLVLRGR